MYNPNGTINVVTEANSAQTTYHYDSSVCNGLLPTSVSEPRGLDKSMTWDCNGGVMTSLTDENGKITTFNYRSGSVADPFYRPLSVVDPLTNTMAFSYTPTSVERAMNFNGTISTSDTLTTSDGFGHTLL